MSRLVQTSDFKNDPWKIPLNPDQDGDLQAVIDEVENEYIPKMFGKSLADLFIIDWDTLPVGPIDARFVFIYEPFTYQDNSCFLQSDGMKDMIRGIVYYLYIRDKLTRVTTVGVKRTKSSNSDNVSGTHIDINRRYNSAINSFQTMQYYMACVDSTLYPEFEGIQVDKNHIF